jgi:hypothetical protein
MLDGSSILQSGEHISNRIVRHSDLLLKNDWLRLFLPTGFDYAGDESLQRVAAETNATEFETAHETARPATLAAAVADALGIFTM